MKKSTPQKESDIQKQIFHFANGISREYNFLIFSIPNEGIMTALSMFGVDGKTKSMLTNHFKAMGLVPGIPDMCLLCNSRAIFFEIKKPGEKARTTQNYVHKKITDAGHTVYVIWSLDDFKYVLKSEGVMG